MTKLNPKPSTLIPKRVGIVGGGQLGQMLTIAAKNLGYYVAVVDPTPQSPAGQVADKQIIGGYKDDEAIRELAKDVDVITVDAEFVNTDTLSDLEKQGKQVFPSPQTIEMIKDKLKQKQFLQKNNIPTADFFACHSDEGQNPEILKQVQNDIKKAGEQFGYPMLLKARTDAYDGKGNFVVHNESDIAKGLEHLKNRELYVEKFVPFVKELAIMCAQNQQGEIVTYPVVETHHKDNVLDYLTAPADISEKARKNAQKLAQDVMQHLKGAGVFGIEIFLTKEDNVLVNELAPRVHNSGHYTIEASVTSQFEQHIRAITNLPLRSTAFLPKAVVMKNILGTHTGPGVVQGLEKVLKIEGVSIHMYNKHESRIGRKLGHITVVGSSISECLRKAEEARKALVI